MRCILHGHKQEEFRRTIRRDSISASSRCRSLFLSCFLIKAFCCKQTKSKYQFAFPGESTNPRRTDLGKPQSSRVLRAMTFQPLFLQNSEHAVQEVKGNKRTISLLESLYFAYLGSTIWKRTVTCSIKITGVTAIINMTRKSIWKGTVAQLPSVKKGHCSSTNPNTRSISIKQIILYPILMRAVDRPGALPSTCGRSCLCLPWS